MILYVAWVFIFCITVIPWLIIQEQRRDCVVNKFSSRTCERGTNGCDVVHGTKT